jgi:hypothetical protein
MKQRTKYLDKDRPKLIIAEVNLHKNSKQNRIKLIVICKFLKLLIKDSKV